MTEPRRTRSERRQRTCLIAVRLLPTEKDALRAAAERHGLSVSDFVRRAALIDAQRDVW